MPRAQIAWPEALIGLGLIAFAGVVLWQTLAIPVSPLYSKVGPTVFPYMTVGGLAILGGFLLVSAARGGWQPEEEKEVALDRRALFFVAAGLLANVLLIGPLGFTVASTVLFVLVAHGIGSRRPVRDVLIGLVFSLISYFGFAKALGVNIGAGVLERLLGG
ncbi:tripartite tricarboxylate transporter TctB family protein [Arenibaculum pallidiluteum]|uniref:tripartite tricarboxylate transporter TctB family protein n=1 Tax=Arenibaculum pallidiluteum TaxID=2812559 RepID=UPI001A9591BA|nr:tripartite tricarboxylate transporter TctB family protein [Arenibaculum pallidiluteum]